MGIEIQIIEQAGVSLSIDEQVIEVTISDVSIGFAGAGLPTGGTAGQVPVKLSSTNYDIAWQDQASGGGGVSIGLAAGLAIALG